MSDWGFDFRPDYQRLTRTLLQLAPDTPVLATTATANQRVTLDVAAQLGAETVTLRGSLARASLRLAVVPGLSALEGYAWVAEALQTLPGSGIVYVLTVAETERLTAFLVDQGLDVAAYSGQSDNRETLEGRLLRNQIKALVATSALGMGYDKPDLAFCIHLGSPASPVAYYQQIGRAGRALDDAIAVLVPGPPDERIWEYFATSGIPTDEQVERILDALGDGPQSLGGVEAATGIRRGRLETLLKILAVDEVVTQVPRRVGGDWPGLVLRRAEVVGAAPRPRRRGRPDAPVRARRGLPDGVPAARPGRPGSAAVRTLLGVRRAPAGAGRASQLGAGGGGKAVLPRARRGHRAAEALGQRPSRPQGQDRRRGARPRAGFRRRPGLGRRPAPCSGSGTPRRRRRCWTGWFRCWCAGRRAGNGRSPWWPCRPGGSRSWSPPSPSKWPGSAGCRWSTRCG